MLAADLALRRAIQHPSPEARAARAEIKASRAVSRARGKMSQRRANLDAALETNEFVDSLRAVAEEAAPASSHRAAWPSDVRELSEKIDRESRSDLNPGEAPVRERDRRMVLAQIPRGIAIEMNDPAPFPKVYFSV